jgi:adenosylcobinamide-phosphate synthase
MAPLLTLGALLIEAVVGYPGRLLETVGHPVMWIGWLIDTSDRTLNRADLGRTGGRVAGSIAIVVVVAIIAAAAWGLQRLLLAVPLGPFAAALAASTLLAQRSLHQHVSKVALALETGGIAAGREAVSHIVGRDPLVLDEAGIARAAIESLAENFSDGIVAPALWLMAGGLPGGAAYKAINTADSMVGHMSPRHQHFGYAVARLDDLVNLPASRLAALLIAAAALATPGASAAGAVRAIVRDAHHHRSPNAGYPEAAMAGALGLALAGPRVYATGRVDDALMGDGRRDATSDDIGAALALFRRADALLILLAAVVVLVTVRA